MLGYVYLNLHSNMDRLKPVTCQSGDTFKAAFTFQYG